MTEAIATPTLRAGFVANYYVPRTSALTPEIPFDLALPSPGFLLGAGAVVISGSTITTPAKYYSSATNAAADGWGLLAINSLNQLYADPTSGQVTVRQIPASSSGTFIANCLPICEVTTDPTGLIRSLVDWRPSYI